MTVKGNGIPNMRIKVHYDNELNLIELFLRKDSFPIFWTWIAELIVECFGDGKIPCLNDVMGDIMTIIKGNNDYCNDIFLKVEDKSSQYDEYVQMYGISSEIIECGEFYNYLLRNNDEEKKELVVMAFTDYIENIAPFVYEESVNWLLNQMPYDFDKAKRDSSKENYKGYIAKYKGLKKVFQK